MAAFIHTLLRFVCHRATQIPEEQRTVAQSVDRLVHKNLVLHFDFIPTWDEIMVIGQETFERRCIGESHTAWSA